jgi:hypothetical protein
MSHFKNVHGILCKLKHKFKIFSKIKRWSLSFYFFILTSYNNIYYKLKLGNIAIARGTNVFPCEI